MKSPRKTKRKLLRHRRLKVSALVPAPEVKVVALPPTGIVQVQLPAGVLPVVAVDPVRKIVEIVPVRRLEPRKKSWWESLFS